MTRDDGSIGRRQQVGRTGERTLYLIDIENMVGRSSFNLSDVAKMQDRIQAAIAAGEGDHVIIASSHHNGAAMMFGWSGSAERKMLSGQDGADQALLACVGDVDWIARRYGRVVIASGDHAFAFTLSALKSAGVDTILLPPDVGCSRALRRAAGTGIVPLGSAHPKNVIALFPTPKDAA